MSVLLVSLTTMLKLELPHVNILSKVDLIEQYGELPFSLDYFTEVLDLSYLCDRLDDSMTRGTGESTNSLPLLVSRAFLRGWLVIADGQGQGQHGERPVLKQSKYSKLNRAMAELVEDFSLVGFTTLAVEDKESMANVLRLIDKAKSAHKHSAVLVIFGLILTDCL